MLPDDLTVRRDSTNTSINNAEGLGDYWNFSGIYRPVYIQAFPAARVDRVAVNSQAAESPNLYNVEITLFNNAGARLHTVTERFGFRTIEVRAGSGAAWRCR